MLKGPQPRRPGTRPPPSLRVSGHQPCPRPQRVRWSLPRIPTLAARPAHKAAPQHTWEGGHIQASGHVTRGQADTQHTWAGGHTWTHVGKWTHADTRGQVDTRGHAWAGEHVDTHRAASSLGPQSPLQLRHVGLKGLAALPNALRRPRRTHKVTFCHFWQQVGRGSGPGLCLFPPGGRAFHTHVCKCVHTHTQVTQANTHSHAHKQVQTQLSGSFFTNSGSEGLPQG